MSRDVVAPLVSAIQFVKDPLGCHAEQSHPVTPRVMPPASGPTPLAFWVETVPGTNGIHTEEVPRRDLRGATGGS